MAQDSLRVYISSTFGDLAEHREVVRRSIVAFGELPVLMETFGASESAPLERCRAEVSRSDVVILLVAHRYGAVLPGAQTSVIEFEYSTAREAAIPVLVFVVDPEYLWPSEFVDGGDDRKRLAAFKKRLQSESVVGYFTTPSDLAVRVIQALIAFRSRRGLDLDKSPAPELTARRAADAGGDSLTIKIEDHLNYLRTVLSEMREHFDSTRAGSVAPAESVARSALFLGPAATLEADLCFVAMPYSQEWSKALEDILLDICKVAGMRLLIAKNMDGRFVPHDIWQGITSAAVIVADITDGNPNVAYEIGLADVLGKDVILLCQGDDVPFDFLAQRLIRYENTMKGSIVLREELTARLKRVREKLSR